MEKRILRSSPCILCDSANENVQHLYIDCPYSTQVWSAVKKEAGIASIVYNSAREWKYIINYCVRDNQAAKIRKTLLGARINEMRKERNCRTF